jgi:hypothetical protein
VSEKPGAGGTRRPAGTNDGSRKDDEPVLPRTPPEDRDEAWGDAPRRRDRDWYERERPPHHE